MASDPTIDALREVLEESLDEIRRGIAGLTVEQLNVAPAGGDTNSIAVIATHALGSTLSWLSLAMGAPLPARDRDAEFRAVADERFAALDRGHDRALSGRARRRRMGSLSRGHARLEPSDGRGTANRRLRGLARAGAPR